MSLPLPSLRAVVFLHKVKQAVNQGAKQPALPFDAQHGDHHADADANIHLLDGCEWQQADVALHYGQNSKQHREKHGARFEELDESGHAITHGL